MTKNYKSRYPDCSEKTLFRFDHFLRAKLASSAYEVIIMSYSHFKVQTPGLKLVPAKAGIHKIKILPYNQTSLFGPDISL